MNISQVKEEPAEHVTKTSLLGLMFILALAATGFWVIADVAAEESVIRPLLAHVREGIASIVYSVGSILHI